MFKTKEGKVSELTFPGPDGILLTLSLRWETVNGVNRFVVSLDDGSGIWANGIVRSNFKAVPAEAAGKYTMLLPVDMLAEVDGDDIRARPQGTGWATVVARENGQIKVAGRLGDGAPFTAGSLLGMDSTFWLSAAPYGKKARGEIAGELAFVPDEDEDRFITGELRWMKVPRQKSPLYPDGFDLLADAYGEPYVRPKKRDPDTRSLPGMGTVDMEFSGGDLAEPLAVTLLWSSANDWSFSAPVRKMKSPMPAGKFRGLHPQRPGRATLVQRRLPAEEPLWRGRLQRVELERQCGVG